MGASASSSNNHDFSFCAPNDSNVTCTNAGFSVTQCNSSQPGSFADEAELICNCAGLDTETVPCYELVSTYSSIHPKYSGFAEMECGVESGGSASEIAVSIIVSLYFVVPVGALLLMLVYRHYVNFHDVEVVHGYNHIDGDATNNAKQDAAPRAQDIGAETADEAGKDDKANNGIHADGDPLQEEPLKNEALKEQEKPPPSCYLSYKNLKYAVKLSKAARKAVIAENGGKPPKERNWDVKPILKGLNGSFTPGSLSAIMGPSGCGKSTLLDTLADRKHDGTTTGSVLVNGVPRDRFYKRISAYVMQSDALFPHLTVRELLCYTAELRLSGSNSTLKACIVSSVIESLDLRRVEHSRIGGEQVRGISGGQARRVTVAVELLTKPSILFCDEPTTGLDAYSSLQLVQTLRKLADEGRTVICTIHQPRPDIFKLFDTLLLMKSGQTAYMGPVAEIPKYFRLYGIEIPSNVNHADFVVDLTYSTETPEDGVPIVDLLVDCFPTSYLGRETQSLVDALEDRSLDSLPPPVVNFFVTETMTRREEAQSRFSQPIYMQVYVLLRRSYVNISRNRSYFLSIFLQSLQFLFYGLLFLGLRFPPNERPFVDSDPQLRPSPQSPLLPEVGILIFKRSFLFQVMNTVCIIESVVIATAFLEKSIFLREHASGAYSVIAYHAQWIIRLVVDAIWKGLLATILSYFLPPMRTDGDAIVFFAVTMMVMSIVGSSLAFLMVSAIPDAQGANNIHNTIIGFMGTYSGFYLPPQLIPYGTIFAYFISFMKYSFEALILNEFGPCMSPLESDTYLGHDTRLNKWTNLLVLMAYPVIFHAVALLASFARTRPKSFWVKHCGYFFKEDVVEIPEEAQEQDENQGQAHDENQDHEV